MKVLVTGDWHIGVTSFGVIDADNRNSRLVDFERALQRSIDVAIEESVDLYICAGDIFHTCKPTIEDQRIFYRVLRRLEDSKIKSRFIIGNHDYTLKIGASHALKIFMDVVQDWLYVKIYDQTVWEDFDNLKVCFFPYHAEEPQIQDLRTDTMRVALVCHSHLEGAVVGCEPFEIKDDKATKFKDLPVDFVFAGHFHKPQILSKSPLAFYPGSISPVDFNERNDVKGVVLVDTHDRTMKCAAINSRNMHQIDIDWTTGKGTDIHNVVDIVDAIVKVNIKMSEAQSSKFDEESIRKTIMDAGAHSIASINVDIVREEIKRSPDIKLDSGIESNFEKYLALRNYGDDTNRLRRIGRMIISESFGT